MHLSYMRSTKACPRFVNPQEGLLLVIMTSFIGFSVITLPINKLISPIIQKVHVHKEPPTPLGS